MKLHDRIREVRFAFDERDNRHYEVRALADEVMFLEHRERVLLEAPKETVNRDSMILALAWSLNATPEEVAEQIELLRGER